MRIFTMKREFYKFPKIEGFENAVYHINKLSDDVSEITYTIKPKLHGTNGAIVVFGGCVYPQSRRRVLYGGQDDNMGFAQFVESNKHRFEYNKRGNFVIYGEWCGNGIQQGDAITKLDKRVFCVFAINDLYNDMMYSSYDSIINYMEYIDCGDDIIVIPDIAEVVLNVVDGHEKFASEVNEIVDRFEIRDDFVYNEFGIDGYGEGVVASIDGLSRKDWSKYTFKAKTESHRAKKTKKAVNVSTKELSDSESKFVDMFASDSRFDQAIFELGIVDYKVNRIGEFLKWVYDDIVLESIIEREENNINMKNVSKIINNKAKVWFMAKQKEIACNL